MSAAPLLDRAVIDDLVEHVGAAAARPVFELFLGESRTLVARMVEAADDRPGRETVRRAAHSLKSGAGQLGAAALAVAAADLEQVAGEDAPNLAEHIAQLRRCAAETETALADFLNRGG